MAMNSSEVQTLVDPVCGTPVERGSPHTYIRGGALFFFCCESCRAQFLARRLNVVALRLAPLPMPAPTVPSPRPPLPLFQGSIPVDGGTPSRDSPEQAADQRFLAAPAPEIPPWHGGTGLRGLLAARLNAWRERRHAERTSRDLLALYRQLAATNPGREVRELFKMVVMTRLKCDPAAAEIVLRGAAESFAEWPVPRGLTLGDVAHYVAISEFLALHRGERWMHSDIKQIVADRIPGDICAQGQSKAASL